MEGLTQEEKMIKDLEVKVLNLKNDNQALSLINAKLGYSTSLMSEFHLSQEDKVEIAASFDAVQDEKKIKEVYDFYHKKFYNKALEDETGDFQWSDNFKNKIRYYFAVSLGYDPIAKIGDNLSILAQYFNLENKIRSTPEADKRNPMVEKLMKDRPSAVDAMNNAIDIINSFNEEES